MRRGHDIQANASSKLATLCTSLADKLHLSQPADEAVYHQEAAAG
jgi:hypothetical protein